MLRLWNAIACVLLSAAVPALSASSQSFENSAIVRTVDLGGSLVHVTTTFAVKALEADASVYTITLPEDEIFNTSWLEVKVKGKQQPLTVTYSGAPAGRSVIISASHLYISRLTNNLAVTLTIWTSLLRHPSKSAGLLILFSRRSKLTLRGHGRSKLVKTMTSRSNIRPHFSC